MGEAPVGKMSEVNLCSALRCECGFWIWSMFWAEGAGKCRSQIRA